MCVTLLVLMNAIAANSMAYMPVIVHMTTSMQITHVLAMFTSQPHIKPIKE